MKGKRAVIFPTKNAERHIGARLKTIYSQDYNGQIEVCYSNTGRTADPTTRLRVFSARLLPMLDPPPEGLIRIP